MSSSYRLELEKWLSQLEVKADMVLDIGGSQFPVKGRTKSWEVKDYKIADLPQPHQGNKPDILVDVNFGGTDPITYQIDLIFCLEVFEYVWNPVEALTRIKNTLIENGKAYVTFPTLYPIHEPVEEDCLRYTEAGIRKLANAVGLKITGLVPRRTETDAIYRGFRQERMRPAKGVDHNISGWIVEFTR